MSPALSSITELVAQPMHEEDLDRLAVALEGGEEWTYRELAAHAHRYAHVLQRAGVVAGDRVAMLLYNSLEYWALYLAITRLGAIAVRVNFRLAPPELDYVLSDSGAAVVCLHDDFADAVAGIRDPSGAIRYLGFPHGGETPPAWLEPFAGLDGYQETGDVDVPVPDAGAAAMIMYTSGTTGRPKGAVWTHGNSLWFAVAQALEWKYDRTTVAMTTGPLYHVGAFEDLLLPALVSRGTAVITRSGGFDIERMMTVLAERRVTDTLIYPFMIYEMLSHPRLGEFDLSALRRITTGGSAIATWAVEAMLERLPGVDLIPTYGLTEGGGIATIMPSVQGTQRHPDSVGKPLPFTEVRVAGPTGEEVARDEVGEVWVRSPSVSREYWGKPEASAETFVDGWCRTGDLGRVTPDGFLVLAGRQKEMIKSGGENIYPLEVENALTLHDEIVDAAVIGVPDERFQEAVCAFVVLTPGSSLTVDDIIEHSRTRLASYKKPRHVFIVDELPRTPSGKVTKYVLRERFDERAAL
ncbi:MAG TPA: AMP-binding protein [Pseudolysinimonas sp.]|nr:AMP-binding protein [Pseudolysinimonas sp.]